jgi:hypothetical protein
MTMGDKFYPDAKEPHIHEHKGGVTYTAVGHAHKILQKGNETMKANCKSVYEELKAGDDRQKKIAAWIKEKLM